MASRAQIINWFKRNLKPTQEQFAETWNSFWHKQDVIPQSSIENLETTLDSKAERSTIQTHLTDADAHTELFAAKADKYEKFKVIDADVLNGVYKVLPEDFFKVLVSDSADDVTLVFSTGMGAFTTGDRVKIYQTGVGKVTVASDGFALNHSADELREIYGAYCWAEVVITDAANLQASLYGKLKLL